jgi:hypothetical protein
MIDHDRYVRFIFNDPKAKLFSALLFSSIKLQAVSFITCVMFNLKIFFDNL